MVIRLRFRASARCAQEIGIPSEKILWFFVKGVGSIFFLCRTENADLVRTLACSRTLRGARRPRAPGSAMPLLFNELLRGPPRRGRSSRRRSEPLEQAADRPASDHTYFYAGAATRTHAPAFERSHTEPRSCSALCPPPARTEL